MNKDFIDYLKTLEDIKTDKHSGSYELITKGVERLANVAPEDIDDYDLEMLFHFGNLKHGKEARDKNIRESHLLEIDKKYMLELNEKIVSGNYTNHPDADKSNCGLFAKGKLKLIGTIDKETAQEFIQMLVDISKINDDKVDDIFRVAESYLSKKMKGLGAGIASQILHLFKPNIFPILNSVGRNGYKNKIGLLLENETDINYYIHNARIIYEFKNKEVPDLNFRTIDVAFWENQSSTSISYWLGGATYGGTNDVSQSFIKNGVFAIRFGQEDMTDLLIDPTKLKNHIANISDTAARSAFELLLQMKAGDKIALKSSFAKGNDSILRIKAIGIILENMENGCIFNEELGHTIPVDWKPIEPYVDYELGTYRRTIQQVTKKEDIETIFNGKNQYLRNEFVDWLSAQKKSDGEAFNSVDTYERVLRLTCGKLKDLDLPQPDLFYQTNAKVFADLKIKIKNSIYYIAENQKASNGAFSPAMDKYETFLIEREKNNLYPDELLPTETQSSSEDSSNDEIEENTPINKKEIETLTLNCLGGLKKEHTILKRASLFELNSGKNVLIRQSKLLPTGYFYGLQKAIVDGDERIDYLILVKGEEGFYKFPYALIKELCLDGSISFADKGKSANETAKGYRIYLALHNDKYMLKFPGSKPSMDIDKFFTKFKYTRDDFLSEVYFEPSDYDDLIALLDRKMNIILQGAPGVGKSYMAKRLAYSIIGFKDKSKVEMVQFHQSYSYEDFIEGFRPNEEGTFEIRKGIFYNFCEKAKKDGVNKYFIIIDEINRGNLSKIMGELMLLLENDKRGEEFAMSLTYSCDEFYVPENVYIIGMMNTADRSLAMIDYALRRRFSFIQIDPAFDNKKFIADFRANYPDADTVIEKMQKLNTLIADELDDGQKNGGHQIGHSYFCSDKPFTEKDIEGIFKYEIEELIREYFFDNENKRNEALGIIL